MHFKSRAARPFSARKTRKKRIVVTACAAAAVGIAVFCAIYGISHRSGWIDDDTGTRYRCGETGEYAVGRKEIDGRVYRFDKEGRLQIGWIEDEAGRMYADRQTGLRTGICEIEGKLYCFDDGFYLKTGLIDLNGKKYYAPPRRKIYAETK